ncbi:MAG TPA: MMPL family transporter [bacterium]|nr:MMPL family transporter [bacterium]
MICITMVTGYAARRLQIDPTTDLLFNKRSPEYKFYREFSAKFGSDHMIAVAMETPDLFTKEALDELKDLTDEIAGFSQVERVTSLANAMDIRHKLFGVKIVPALQSVYEDDKSPNEIKDEILQNELYRNNLVSPDGRIANIIIYLKSQEKHRGRGGEFIKELRKLLDARARPDYQFYVAGSPVEQYDFIQLIRKDQFVFLPLITLLLVVVTWWIYRSFACMLLAMVIVFMTLIWSMGTIVLVGGELNLVTSLLAPVIMIIAVVNVIHIMTLFFSIRVHHPQLEEAVVVTMTQLGIPCFLSHLTIMLGFISLLFDPVPAIQNFGVYAAMGTFYSYIVSTFLTPVLLPLLPPRAGHETFQNKKILKDIVVAFLEKLEFYWKWWIFAAAVMILGLSIYGITKLEVDTNLIKQMKPDQPLSVSTRFIDKNLTGVYTLGFVLRSKKGESLANFELLDRIDRFKDFLESRPEIAKVNGITTLVKKINEAREGDAEGYIIPEDNGRLKTYFQGMTRSKDPELSKILTSDGRQTRLEARMRAVGTKQGALLEDDIRSYMENELKDYFDYHLTGNVVLLGRMSKDLVLNQIKGFIFAFISILLAICVIFQSLRMGLLAAIPNILPILAVYGIMGFAGIEMSSPTAMISSIVLGMVVDASIHFLYRFRLEFSHRHQYLQALHHTYRRVGRSLTISTMILVAGFASSVFAGFRVTVLFGLLTGLAIFFSLLSSMILLPFFLIALKPFGRERLFFRPSRIDTPRHV